MKPSKFFSVVWDYFLISLGTLVFCMAWTSFLIPNGLASGGLTGFCTILQYGTGIPVGLTYPIINILLIVLGIVVLGKSFGVKTLYVIALSSAMFEILPHFPVLEVTDFPDKLLVAIVGATMESVGIGLILLRGGSTGGTDIIAMIINKYWPVSPGKVYLYTDVFIIALLLLVPEKGIVDMIYAYVVMLGFSFGVDFVILGNKSTVQILIFSKNYSEIADYIANNLKRGVTALDSVGWYSQKEGKVLLVISRKHQMKAIVNAVKHIDRDAFISISPANSVYGEGFEEVKTGLPKKEKKD